MIYPPAEAKGPHRAGPESQRDEFLLYLGRLVPYKRVDLLVRVASRFGMPTVIAGDGPELDRLKAMAGPTVHFLGYVADDEAAGLLERCAAFVFCAEEDFGIAPVEANAHGAPVVALRAGGVIESMREGATAVFFDEPTENSLAEAIRRALGRSWDPQVLRANAARFSPERFRAAA